MVVLTLLLSSVAAGAELSLRPVELDSMVENLVRVEGTGFAATGMKVRLQLRGPRGDEAVLIPARRDGSSLVFTMPALQPPGERDVQVVWPDGRTECVEGGLTVVFTGCTMEPVYFAVNEATLDATASSTIARNAWCMRAGEVRGARVLGFADERGELETNRDLSLLRAQAVESALRAQLGDTAGAFEATLYALGEQRPENASHDEAAWAQNRRVELSGLSSSEWQNATCAPIRVKFEPGSSAIPVALRDDIRDDALCFPTLGVNEIVVFASPDPGEEIDWSLAYARAGALERLINGVVRKDGVTTPAVAFIPHSGNRLDGYGEAAVLEMYDPESPRPTSEHLILAECAPVVEVPPEQKKKGPETPDPILPNYNIFPGYNVAHRRRETWSLVISGGPGLDTGRGLGGDPVPVAAVTARFGQSRGPFAGLSARAALPEGDADVTALGGLEFGADGLPPHAAWVGYAALGRRIDAGADVAIGSAASGALVVFVGARGGLGLENDAPWRVGADLSVAWRMRGTREEN